MMGQLFAMILYQMVALLFSPLFWLVVLIIWMQSRRSAKLKSTFFHVPITGVWKKTFQGVGYGLLGGVIGSVLLVLLGVSVYEIGIGYLWIVALVLIMFNQRFMCFAYSGGILALSKYLFGWPVVNIGQLMALIAVLHFVEAILILLSGRLQAIPIYVKGREGTLVGGFSMQNFWPLPLVALMATIVPIFVPVPDVMIMPNWWPLLPMESLGAGVHSNIVYSMIPVLAALGYSDLALTTSAQEKIKTSSAQLLIYSILLMLLAVLGGKVPVLAILPALFAPLGHEYLIRLGQKKEMGGQYRFIAPKEGVMILDILEKSPAALAGLRSEDIILSLDNHLVHNHSDFFALANTLPNQLAVIIKRQGEAQSKMINKWDGQGLGVILAPDPNGREYLDFNSQSGLWRVIWKKVKKCYQRLRK